MLASACNSCHYGVLLSGGTHPHYFLWLVSIGDFKAGLKCRNVWFEHVYGGDPCRGVWARGILEQYFAGGKFAGVQYICSGRGGVTVLQAVVPGVRFCSSVTNER